MIIYGHFQRQNGKTNAIWIMVNLGIYLLNG